MYLKKKLNNSAAELRIRYEEVYDFFNDGYGEVENAKHHIVVNTPFGKYTIEKKDGGVSFMGMSAKLVSAKNGVYQVMSSLGNFSVNTRKGTITKR